MLCTYGTIAAEGKEMKDKKVELLMPAGSLETMKTAILYGADAVYLGGSSFSLRAKADNFTPYEMKEGISYAHSKGVKVYLTVNIYAHNYDLEGVRKYLAEIKDYGFDAVLVSDPGIFTLVKEIIPDIEIHISTQANNTNYMTFNFWHSLGASRIVCAREMSLAEIKETRANIPDDLEIEAFMHGAMCISYSGRCLLSSYFTGRDANKGACTHPCRWKYAVVEEKRPGEYLPVEEDERGTYIFNSKDLCMVNYIPEMVDAGIYSFKVEGRMKTALYVASVAKIYREAIDDYLNDIDLYRSKADYYMREISACTYRQFTTGFYFSKPDSESQIYDSNTYVQNFIYLGSIEDVKYIEQDEKNHSDNRISDADMNDGNISDTSFGPRESMVEVLIHQKNKFSIGDDIEIVTFKGDNVPAKVAGIMDEFGNSMDSAPHPKQELHVVLEIDSQFSDSVRTGMVIRSKNGGV